MNQRRTSGRARLRTGAGLAAVLMVATAGLAGAEEYDLGDSSGEGPNTQIFGQAWDTSLESRVFEAQENIPFDVRYGQPITQVDLITPPVQCQVYASQYYFGSLVEEGVFATTGLYYNRTLARSRNPSDGGKGIGGSPRRTPKNETGPGTAEAGPYTLAECPNRGTGHGFARAAGVAGLFSGAYSEGRGQADPANKVINKESVANITNVNLEGGVTIKSIHSLLKVAHEIDKEPKFSFEMRIEGVVANGTEIIGSGDHGLVFAGTGLTGPDAIKQFNTQANSQSEALKAIAIYGLKVAEPKFFIDQQFDKFNFEVPVLEGSLAFPSRKGTLGDYQAARFGTNNYRGVYISVDTTEDFLSPVNVEK